MDCVERFIQRRWSHTDAYWTDGNCYWFAHILITRFPYLHLYYLPITGHFIAGDGTNFYDATGKLQLKEKGILFTDLLHDDPTWGARLLRDCRD